VLGAAGDDSRLDRHDPNVERSVWQEGLSETVFRARHVGIAALAVAGAAVPAIGPHRLIIAAAMIVLILPYDIAMHTWVRRTGRMPVTLPFANMVISGVFVSFAPTTWIPGLLVLEAEIALATAAFGRRLATAVVAVGVGSFTVSALAVDHPGELVSLLGFAIAAAMLVLTVGAIFDSEHRVRLRYRALVEGLDAIVWEADPATARFTYVSQAAARILGYPLEKWYEPGFWYDHIHFDDREESFNQYSDLTATGHDHSMEYRMIAADGGVVWIHDLVSVEVDGAGRPTRLRGAMVDVSARRRAEERVRQYADIVERIQVALFVVRLEKETDATSLRIVAANPQTEQLTDRPPDEVVGKRITEALGPVADSPLLELLAKVVTTGEAFDVDNVVVRPRAGERVYSLHAFPLPGHAVGVALDDVTGPRLAADALRRQALHDSLTGLPNRSLLHDRLDQALRNAHRSDAQVALMIMDLDQFKEVNDALGHHLGDKLLVAIGDRLETIVRECDTIARLGGDEFALLLTTGASEEGAVRVAEKVAAALEEPFYVEGISLQTNASVGIALYPDHAGDPDSLAQRADVAMYMAKGSARSYAVYAPEADRSSVRRLTLLGELRRAVLLDELELHYQPSVDLRTGEVVRAEALVRWRHPRHGLMPPSEFIPLAEVSGVIQPLTRWVIQRAVAQATAWRNEGLSIDVAVNLSVRNLYDRELGGWLQGLLRSAGLPPSALTLEITENEVMDDPLLAMEVLGQARDMGVLTSIDDFGTGYSSLSYLKHLPIDELKIDRSFVAGMMDDDSDEVIVRAIIDLAHNLGLTVVAEGVEDGQTLGRLTELGCDRAQGFHLGRPVPPADLVSALRAG
jgi:diguanylate cyclase (GGDEF)-like protein/PAS domain S-box-containing protein